MQDSKIIRLLKSLDAGEFRLLSKYLRSPFFNYSTSILALYEILRKYYPAFTLQNLEREKIFAKVFPGEAFHDKKFRNLLHEFLGHVENFLVQLRIREDEFLAKKLLMESLATKNQYSEFVQKNRELIAEAEARPYRDIPTYHHLLQLHEQYYFHPLTNKLQDGADALKAILANLDHYFIANKLRLANEAAAREKVVQQYLPIHFMDAVLAKLKEKDQEVPLLTFYKLLYRLNEKGETALFFALKKKLLDQSERLSFSDQQVVLFQLLNCAIRNGNKGSEEFLREAFQLYMFGLEKKLIFENGKLTDSTFTNIVFGGGKIGALDQVESFIVNYGQFLEAQHQEDAVTLAYAFLFFKKKEYKKVDTLIGNFTFSSSFYELRARTIFIRALFELFYDDNSFFDLLISRMNAFEKYLKRNKNFSSLQRDPYLGLLKYLKKLTVLYYENQYTRLELEKLSDSVVKAAFIMDREWLLEQIKILRNDD